MLTKERIEERATSIALMLSLLAIPLFFLGAMDIALDWDLLTRPWDKAIWALVTTCLFTLAISLLISMALSLSRIAASLAQLAAERNS